MKQHLRDVRRLHGADLAPGWEATSLPEALARKYTNANREWKWQWVSPQRKRWLDPETGQEGRHHLDPSVVQRAVKEAVQKGGITKAAGCHTFCRSFATHLLE